MVSGRTPIPRCRISWDPAETPFRLYWHRALVEKMNPLRGKMMSLITTLSRWWVGVKKSADRLVDVVRPTGHVEFRLYHAEGDDRGKLYRTIRGQNIVTSWLSAGGASPTSGRDMMRRLLIPAAFPESLSGAAAVGFAELGSGVTAEKVSDTGLVTPIGGVATPTTLKALSSVVLDPVNPYVTFVFDYGSGDANTTISEAMLYSDRAGPGPAGRGDAVARKTFAPFTKTSAFTLQLRWQIRL